MVFGYHMLNILELNTLFVSVVRLWNLNVCLFCRAQDLSDAEPTITHMCISQLYRKGHVCSTAFQKKKNLFDCWFFNSLFPSYLILNLYEVT